MASKVDMLKTCRSRVKAAQNYREQEGLDVLWDQLRDMYRGKHFPSGLNDEDRIAVNLSFSTINVIGPSVAIGNPKIAVNATKEADVDKALIVETVLNYWWRTKNIKAEFFLGVQDYLIFGFGWLKTGYRFIEEDVDRNPSDIDDEYGKLNDEADTYAQDNPDFAADLPTPDEIAANIPQTETKVVEDQPFVEHVAHNEIFVDPLATKMRNARWIAQRLVKDISEVRKNPNYKAGVRRHIKSNVTTTDKYWALDENKKSLDAQQVVVWEFYDIRDGTMCVFTESDDDGFLVDPTPQPYKFGHPFVMLRNYEVPDTFYTMGELEAIEGLQQELDKTRSQLMNDRKKYGRKYLYDRKAFSPDAVGMLQSSRDNAMIPVNDGVPLDEAIIPMAITPSDPSIYQQSEQITADIDTVTGVNEYQRGGASQDVRRTATEASLIADTANARSAYKLSQIEDFCAYVARRLVMLAQQYMTEEQSARVVGDMGGKPVWFDFDPEMIQGEFDFEVEAGTTRPNNTEARREEAMQLFSVLGPLMESGLVNGPTLLKHVLVQGFNIKDPTKFLGPAALGPPPGQEEEPPPPPGDVTPMPDEPQSQMPQQAPPGMEAGLPPEGMPPPPPGGGLPPELMAMMGGAPA